MEAKIDALEIKVDCLELKVPDALDLSHKLDKKIERLKSSVEERTAIASKKFEVPIERITEMLKDIENTRSTIEKTKTLIPDISSLQSKVDDIDVALADYKKTFDSLADASGTKRLLALENLLAKLHQRTSTLEKSAKDHEVSSMKTRPVTKNTCQGDHDPPSPKILNSDNNPRVPGDPVTTTTDERKDIQHGVRGITSSTTAKPLGKPQYTYKWRTEQLKF